MKVLSLRLLHCQFESFSKTFFSLLVCTGFVEVLDVEVRDDDAPSLCLIAGELASSEWRSPQSCQAKMRQRQLDYRISKLTEEANRLRTRCTATRKVVHARKRGRRQAQCDGSGQMATLIGFGVKYWSIMGRSIFPNP